MPQIDLNRQNICFDAISVNFSKDFVLSSNTINSTTKKTRFALHLWSERQKHFRMTPKESKYFNIFVFVQLVYFLSRFGVRMLANVQQGPTL